MKNQARISFFDLKNREDWEEAVIVFTEDSFSKPYTEVERSYKINADAYYFDGDKISSSLFGNCLDGKDDGVRLDIYIHRGWNPEYCYITKYKE